MLGQLSKMFATPPGAPAPLASLFGAYANEIVRRSFQKGTKSNNDDSDYDDETVECPSLVVAGIKLTRHEHRAGKSMVLLKRARALPGHSAGVWLQSQGPPLPRVSSHWGGP